MTTAIEQLTQLMTTTQTEDEQYSKEVISEIKIKWSRGRPRIHPVKDPNVIGKAEWQTNYIHIARTN